MSTTKAINDHGSDPIGNGMFRMVPSGDIVDKTERDKRLSGRTITNIKNDCLGLSWEQIEEKQGSPIRRNK
jgi:hypothetical protein